MATLNSTETARLAALNQKQEAQRTDAEKAELAALVHKRDQE
jgi:hypothetical protein